MPVAGHVLMAKACGVRAKTGSVDVVGDVMDLPEGAAKRTKGKRKKGMWRWTERSMTGT